MAIKIKSIEAPVEVRNLPFRKAGRTGTLYRASYDGSLDSVNNFGAASVTGADQATGGSLAFNTLYYFTVIPSNRWGPTKVTTSIDSLTTANDSNNTHAIRFTIAKAAGAEYYEVFLSVDVAPLGVGRMTEAQRASGGFEFTSVGTVASGSGSPAGTVDVNIVGTGQATSATQFSNNNAYRPDVTPSISCEGFSVALLRVKGEPTDFTGVPTLKVVPFFQNDASEGDWHQGALIDFAPLSAAGKSLEQETAIDVRGASRLAICADLMAISAVSMWIELYR